MTSYTQPNVKKDISAKFYQKCLILCSKILLNVLHLTHQLIFAARLNCCIVFLSAEGENSPSKDSLEGKNVKKGSLSAMSQCVATIIAFARIQGDRHPHISYPFPMLRVDPSGVVVLVHDYPNDVLMISQRVPWSDIAFIIVWLVLHYSLFRPDSLSCMSKYCCGYRTASRGILVGSPWYLGSTSDSFLSTT